MAGKPTEIKKVAELLEQDFEDATGAAKAVFDLVEELLNTRERFVVVAVHPSVNDLAIGYGPFDTRVKAEREVKKKLVAVDSKSYARLIPLKMW